MRSGGLGARVCFSHSMSSGNEVTIASKKATPCDSLFSSTHHVKLPSRNCYFEIQIPTFYFGFDFVLNMSLVLSFTLIKNLAERNSKPLNLREYKRLCAKVVFVISGTLIWCPFLLQRENTSDSCPTVLYFPRIKCIFSCEDWHVNQWKELFGMICSDQRLLLITLRKPGWHLRGCAQR